MSEILWSKVIPLVNVEHKAGMVVGEDSLATTPFVSYTIKSLKLQCVRGVEIVEHNGSVHEVVTYKLEALINADIQPFVANKMRLLFNVDVFYSSGNQVDDYATPSGQTFLDKNSKPHNTTIIALADNVKNYSSLIKGDVANKVRFNMYAKILQLA